MIGMCTKYKLVREFIDFTNPSFGFTNPLFGKLGNT